MPNGVYIKGYLCLWSLHAITKDAAGRTISDDPISDRCFLEKKSVRKDFKIKAITLFGRKGL